MIPIKYLSKMGAYTVKVNGEEVKVKVVDNIASLVDSNIAAMARAVSSSSSLGLVGVDIKSIYEGSCMPNELLVLCAGADKCLAIHLPHRICKAPEKLLKFLEDSDICFVGLTRRPFCLTRVHDIMYRKQDGKGGVRAGELAARVLRKPALLESSLGEIAQEVGIRYEGPVNGSPDKICFDSKANAHVLSEDQVKVAVSDAFAYYKIGHKLLSSLSGGLQSGSD